MILDRLKFSAGFRVASFNISPCTYSPYLLHYTTGKLPTLAEIIFSPEDAWTNSFYVVSFKLTNHILCGVVSHVAQVYAIMMLVSSSNLVLSGNTFFGIIMSSNYIWLFPAWLFVTTFSYSEVPFHLMGLMSELFANSQHCSFLWPLLPQLWHDPLSFSSFLSH